MGWTTQTVAVADRAPADHGAAASSMGIGDDSRAQAEQVRSIAVQRVGARLGTVPGPLLLALDEALRLHLAL